MSLTDTTLDTAVLSLPRPDRLRLIHLLLDSLEPSEVNLLSSLATAINRKAEPIKAPVWSPREAHDAAAVLLTLLENTKP